MECSSGTVTFQSGPCSGDEDCDGFLDGSDNCSAMYNPLQTNSDRNFIDQTPPASQDDWTWAKSDALGDACDPDDDNDGRSDAEEGLGAGCSGTLTDPLKRDTDGDLFLDGPECALGTDPANASSKPNMSSCATSGDADADRISNQVEMCKYGTDPNATDTDGDQDGSPAGLAKDGCEVGSLNNDRVVNAADQLILSSAITTPRYHLNVDAAVSPQRRPEQRRRDQLRRSTHPVAADHAGRAVSLREACSRVPVCKVSPQP